MTTLRDYGRLLKKLDMYITVIQVCLTLEEWDYRATSVTTKSSDPNPEN